MIRFFTPILSLFTLVKNRIGKIYCFLFSKTGIIRVDYVTPLARCSEVVTFSDNDERSGDCEESITKKKREEIRGEAELVYS